MGQDCYQIWINTPKIFTHTVGSGDHESFFFVNFPLAKKVKMSKVPWREIRKCPGEKLLFSKIFAEIKIYWKFYPKSKLSKNLNRNQNFMKNLPKIKIIWKFEPILAFMAIWLRNCYFRKLYPKWKFYKNWTQNQNFMIIWPIIKFYDSLTEFFSII